MPDDQWNGMIWYLPYAPDDGFTAVYEPPDSQSTMY
jgi:hypothetical protein